MLTVVKDAGRALGRVDEGLGRAVCSVPMRLHHAIDQWALCALTTSQRARALYDQHRAAGDLDHQALLALANRLVGILHAAYATKAPIANTPPGTPPKHLPRLTTYDPGNHRARPRRRFGKRLLV